MARPIADVLRELGGGATYDELNAALAAIVQAVQDTGRVGELSFKLKVKPNGQSSVLIVDEIKTKVPELPRGETLFFTTAGGGLIRNDPRQENLPLRDVKAPVADELREIG